MKQIMGLALQLILLLQLAVTSSGWITTTTTTTTTRRTLKTLVSKNSIADSEQPDIGTTTSTKIQRRRKTNKYDQFSKVERQENGDPFEQLLAETKVKQQQLQERQEAADAARRQARRRRTRTRTTQQQQQQQLSQQQQIVQSNENDPSNNSCKVVVSKDTDVNRYPDNKDIDPYDPTTFGYIEIATIVGAHGVHGWLKVISKTDFGTERLCQPDSIRHLKPPKKRAPRQVTLLEGRFTKNKDYLICLDGIETRDAAAALRGSTLYVRQEEQVILNRSGGSSSSSSNNAGSNDVDGDAATPETENKDSEETADKEKQQEPPEEYLVSDLVGLEVFFVNNDEDDDDITEDDVRKKNFVGTIGGIVFAEDIVERTGASRLLAHDMLELSLSFNKYVLIPLVPQIVTKVDVPNRAVFVDPPTGLLELTYEKEEKRVRTKGFLPPAK